MAVTFDELICIWSLSKIIKIRNREGIYGYFWFLASISSTQLLIFPLNNDRKYFHLVNNYITFLSPTGKRQRLVKQKSSWNVCKKQKNEQKLGDGEEQKRKKEVRENLEIFRGEWQEEIASKSLGEGF